jgi:hypothetical protein
LLLAVAAVAVTLLVAVVLVVFKLLLRQSQ